ncbi:MAG: hypothetical protein E7H33_09060 [Clostridium perfringens]|nr:hypothetical protein [Clostridium perfringens]
MNNNNDINLILNDESFKRISKKVNILENKISKTSDSLRKMKLQASDENIKYRDRINLDFNINLLEGQLKEDRLILQGVMIGREVIIQTLAEKVGDYLGEK